MKKFHEACRRIGDPDDRFDIEFWQAQGSEAIFKAAEQMTREAWIAKYGHDVEPRLQRTVEHYGKL